MQGVQPLDWHPAWGAGNGAAPQSFSLLRRRRRHWYVIPESYPLIHSPYIL